MATVEETQAELKGQFEQFSHRQQRVETEVDNTRSELTQAISDLRYAIDRLRQDFGNAQKWQWSLFCRRDYCSLRGRRAGGQCVWSMKGNVS